MKNFDEIKEGDMIALRYEGLWYPAKVERVQDRFLYADGIKFLRDSGRQANVYITPVHARPMTQEIRDIIDKRHLVAELSVIDWAQYSAESLRHVWNAVEEYLTEQKENTNG